MKVSIFFRIYFLILFATGCAAGRITIDTSPAQADLYVKMAGAADYQKLGVAPLTKQMSEVAALAARSRSVVIEARKEGFVTRSILVTDVETANDIKLNMSLMSIEELLKNLPNRDIASAGTILDSEEKVEQAKRQIFSELSEKYLLSTNAVVDELFEAQRLTKAGRLDDASRRLDEMRGKYPNVAAIYEMQGGIAFMREDYPKALDAYTTAARNNPTNIELINMRNYLEKKLSVDRRSPAGQE